MVHVDQLHGAVTTDGDVYVSIIPFAKDVNLGASNYNADWIYWGITVVDNNINNPSNPIQDLNPPSDNISWNATRGVCSSGSWSTRSACFANVGTCSVSGYTNQDSCTSSGMCSNGGYSFGRGRCSGRQRSDRTRKGGEQRGDHHL